MSNDIFDILLVGFGNPIVNNLYIHRDRCIFRNRVGYEVREVIYYYRGSKYKLFYHKLNDRIVFIMFFGIKRFSIIWALRDYLRSKGIGFVFL